ncbi:cupin domain-containing protein [Olsenella sp. HMSC062G07]|uniref:cupin domain-containing protein n=1 Tax=Olsenella sp. HMSC062G07 TaxID=1739330 RepID=UPI0008A3C22B|nr:cupin domain-containing protein [Olsenella sp. HMSC062G07]OFK22820.1 hypothetical protein HMPREF2826_00875 [Olsenella sp. HMSC062G07]
MMIDFSSVEAVSHTNFKGGTGSVTMQAVDDGSVRVMRATLHPHSSLGLHRHMGDAEVAYVLSGTGRIIDDGIERPLTPGALTYCPNGKEHQIVNDGDEDLVVLAVIPRLSDEHPAE